MANLENKLLQKESDTNPKLHLRYVEDIFAIFEDQRSSATFLDLLNSLHKNIRFTLENSNGTISFLDVEIKINPNGFDTWIWKKPVAIPALGIQNDAEATPALGLLGLSLSYEMMEGLLLFKF